MNAERKNEIVEIIKSPELSERFNSIAPQGMKFEAEIGYAIQLLKNNDYLMTVAKNHPQSLQQAISNIAGIGLSLNPAEKQAYLIPRNIRVDGKYQSRIFLDPSYVGLLRLATNSGSIEWVQAKPVYASDEFIDSGVGEKPVHKFNPFATLEDRGEFVGVYCVAKTNKGDYLTTVMSAEKVYDIRDRSESWKSFMAKKAKSSVWLTDFEEMAKKTVIRNAFKTWPRSVSNERLSNAVLISNENEGFEPLITSPETNRYTAEQKEFLDDCLKNGDFWELYKLRESLVDGDASSSGAGVWISLVNSFERGQKGRYGALIDEMMQQAKKRISETQETITRAVDSGDDSAIEEIVIESSNEELALYLNGLNYEAVQVVDEIKNKFEG